MDAFLLAADAIAAVPAPEAARAMARGWFFLLLVLLVGVVGLTALGVLFSLRRHRMAQPSRKRQVTSRLSAWEEAAVRARPWEGPDPADLDGADPPR